jgi:hypothetical protein
MYSYESLFLLLCLQALGEAVTAGDGQPLVKLKKVYGKFAMEAKDFDSMDAEFLNILRDCLLLKELSKDIEKRCKAFGDWFRFRLWPFQFSWIIQKQGVFAKPYHTDRLDAMEG